MEKKDNTELLFTRQGCLSAEAVRHYVSGGLSAEELDSIEEHTQVCELCRSALEGALLFEDDGLYTRGLEKMTRKWDNQKTREPLMSKASIAGVLSVAASLILLISLHLIFQRQRLERSDYITSAIFGGESISESLISDGLLLVALSGDERRSGSVREEALRKQFLHTQDIRKTEARLAMLGEIRIYPDVGEDKAKQGELQGNDKTSMACLKYPLKAVTMISPELKTDVRSDDEIPANYQSIPQLDRESIDLFRNFMAKNVRYPAGIKERETGCRVYVQFAINKEGSLIDPVILNSCNPLFDSELLRVLRKSPLWRPGVQDGKPVEVALVMPVEFRPD